MKSSSLRAVILILIIALAISSFPANASKVSQIRPEDPNKMLSIQRIARDRLSSFSPEQNQSQFSNITPRYLGSDWDTAVFQYSGENSWEIYKLTQNYTVTPLTYDNYDDYYPRFNKGSTKIVYSSFINGDLELILMNADGSGRIALTNNAVDDVYPFWSPDGTQIVYESDIDNQAEVFIMNADGSNIRKLTNNRQYDGMPSWSPDGKRIAYVSYQNGGYRIWTMKTDGSDQRQISTVPYSARPVYSWSGDMIAFDGDMDQDGYTEVWTVNPDGSNQLLRYDSKLPDKDYWVSGWSSREDYIVATYVSWIFWNNDWYIDFISAVAVPLYYGEPYGVLNTNFSASCDISSTDAIQPYSSMRPLPVESSLDISLNWSGNDQGPSGLNYFDVQMKDGISGSWNDVQRHREETTAQIIGQVGHTYYFRARAIDVAGNVEPWPDQYDTYTTVEAKPPITQILPLPEYSDPDLINVRWDGYDPGGSGIANYEVQYRDGVSGAWTAWISPIPPDGHYQQAYFQGTPGHQYYFRVRATDNNGNVEQWELNSPPISTTAFQWKFEGTVADHTGVPVAGAELNFDPQPDGKQTSAENEFVGAYFLSETGSYTYTVSKSGYGDLDQTINEAPNSQQNYIVLPPSNNQIQDPGFENGSAEVWQFFGDPTPILTNTAMHSGNWGVSFPGQKFGQSEFVTDTNLRECMVVGKDQSVYSAWSGRAYQDLSLHFRLRVPGGNWSTEEMVFDNLNITGYVACATDSNRVFHVFFSAGYTQLYYASRSSAGVWSVPVKVGQGTYPTLDVDSSGIAHLMWLGDSYPGNSVNYVSCISGGSCSANRTISGNAKNSGYSPNMIVDSKNGVHIFWSDVNSLRLFHSYRDPNGVWKDTDAIGDSDIGIGLFGTIGADGQLYAVWKNGDGLYFSEQKTGNGWTDPVMVLESHRLSEPKLSVDPLGYVHTVWKSPINSKMALLYAFRTPGGIWKGPYLLTSSVNEVSEYYLISDETGQTTIAWTSQFNEINQIHVARGNGASGLLDFIPFDSAYTADDCGLMIDQDGNIHFCYMDNYSVYYAGPAIQPEFRSSSISQVITIPSDIPDPILSCLYQQTNGEYSRGKGLKLILSPQGGSTTQEILLENSAAWSLKTLDMSTWAGQTLTMTFSLESEPGDYAVGAALDDVFLGSGHPDLKVDLQGDEEVYPGDTITYEIHYSNLGLAPAENTSITYTLPSGWSFVSASIPPVIQGNLYTWNMGVTNPKSTGITILLTVRIPKGTLPGNEILSQAVIATSSNELENYNNQNSWETTIVPRKVWLPLAVRYP